MYYCHHAEKVLEHTSRGTPENRSGRARLRRCWSVLTHHHIRVTRGLQSPTNSPRSGPPWFKVAIFVRLHRQRHSSESSLRRFSAIVKLERSSRLYQTLVYAPTDIHRSVANCAPVRNSHRCWLKWVETSDLQLERPQRGTRKWGRYRTSYATQGGERRKSRRRLDNEG